MIKSIAIISGKGGSGKTTLVSNLAPIFEDKVLVDCDVDAPDLYIVMSPKISKQGEFRGSDIAYIDKASCIECGMCIDVCRFDAISPSYVVDFSACEGCTFCERVCPVGAIEMKERIAGDWFIGNTRFGPMVYAKLNPGEENSGKLVLLVRKQAEFLAQSQKKRFVLIDGPPGIGCPVTSSITGTNLVVIVTEPTKSGIHDLERIVKLVDSFNIKQLIVINKFDLNREMSDEIEKFATSLKIPVIGKIPFDKVMVDALTQEITLREFVPNHYLNTIFLDIYKKIMEAVV